MIKYDSPQGFFKHVAKDLATSHDFDDPSYDELKTVTVRLPAYQLLVIDALASAASMTRQNFVSGLINTSIGQAASGLASGFNSDLDPESAAVKFAFDERFNALPLKSQEYLFDVACAAVGLGTTTFEEAVSQMGEH